MDPPIEEDGWELICDSSQVPFLQPTPKACPLSRPDFLIQPRLQAFWNVSQVPDTTMSRTIQTGLRLTLARTSGSAPQAAPAYHPVRSNLMHHVSMTSSPYQRPTRTEYQPESLIMRAQTDMSADRRDSAGMVPDLCPSTEKALPRPPVNKGRTSGARPQTVRSSTAIQPTRSKLASDNAFLVEMFTNLLHPVWEIFGCLCIIGYFTVCRRTSQATAK